MRSVSDVVKYIEFSVSYWQQKLDDLEGYSTDYVRYVARLSECQSILDFIKGV